MLVVGYALRADGEVGFTVHSGGGPDFLLSTAGTLRFPSWPHRLSPGNVIAGIALHPAEVILKLIPYGPHGNQVRVPCYLRTTATVNADNWSIPRDVRRAAKAPRGGNVGDHGAIRPPCIG